MHAAEQAELDELRRRAYADDAALTAADVARLRALEEMAHREREAVAAAARTLARPAADFTEPPEVFAEPPPVPEPEPKPTESVDAQAASAPSPLRSSPKRRRRAVWTAIVAVVLAVAIGFFVLRLVDTASGTLTETTTREAYSLAHSGGEVLQRIPVEHGWQDVDVADGALVPRFPTSGEIRVARHLATLYGWNVWIADADGALQPEQCIVIERDGDARGRCVVAVLRGESALVATLPYELIPEAERPEGMTVDERLGFWWTGDASVYVIRAPIVQ
ncbi:hypothetical protein [Microbacterium sp. bgisy189]|uniref:hypothetical protein n=1 Tax=Microbacterium sp. bgisy189 TaxID=3413798 RepID=UPI003EB7FA82